MRTILLVALTLALGFTSHGLAFAQYTPAPVPHALPNLATAPFTAAPGSSPAPGTVTVHINGRVNSYIAAGSDSGRNPGLVTTAAGPGPQSSR